VTEWLLELKVESGQQRLVVKALEKPPLNLPADVFDSESWCRRGLLKLAESQAVRRARKHDAACALIGCCFAKWSSAAATLVALLG